LDWLIEEQMSWIWTQRNREDKVQETEGGSQGEHGTGKYVEMVNMRKQKKERAWEVEGVVEVISWGKKKKNQDSLREEGCFQNLITKFVLSDKRVSRSLIALILRWEGFGDRCRNGSALVLQIVSIYLEIQMQVRLLILSPPETDNQSWVSGEIQWRGT
jgi:hypothetical protein